MAGLVKRYAALDVKMNGRFGPSVTGRHFTKVSIILPSKFAMISQIKRAVHRLTILAWLPDYPSGSLIAPSRLDS